MKQWSPLKKLIWLYAAKFKGGASAIIETITGNLPLVLRNAIQHSIKSLTRYGLCTQDGTPTPDAPVDIVCNNGVLKWDSVNERIYADGTPEVLTVSGPNLLNSATNITGKYIASNGSISNGDDAQYTDLIPVTVGNPYVCAFTSARDSGTNRLHGYNSNGTWVKQLSYATAKDMQGKKVAMSALIPSGISYIRLSYGQTDTDAIISQEPISSNELYVGRGTYIKSLESTITSPYSFTAYDGFGFVTPVVPESTYVFTWSGTGFNTYGIGFYASIDDVTDASKRISGGDIKGLSTFVVPSGANYAVLVFASSSIATLTLDYLYVNPAPTYAPYVASQTASVPTLLSVGDVKDEVELISGTYTHRCAACLYDGTQDVGDTYLSTTGGKDIGAIIVYPLATPTTEQIAGQNLATNDGTNIVDSVANVGPLTAEVKYYASVEN